MATLTHPPKGVLSCAGPCAVVCRIRRHNTVTSVRPHRSKLDVSPAAACALTSCNTAQTPPSPETPCGAVYTVAPTPPRPRRGQSRRPASLDHTRRHARLFEPSTDPPGQSQQGMPGTGCEYVRRVEPWGKARAVHLRQGATTAFSTALQPLPPATMGPVMVHLQVAAPPRRPSRRQPRKHRLRSGLVWSFYAISSH
jgi:hypothetical protein